MVALPNIALRAAQSSQEDFPPLRRKHAHEDYLKSSAGATKSHERDADAACRYIVSLEWPLRIKHTQVLILPGDIEFGAPDAGATGTEFGEERRPCGS
jgi:hypothetical protein